MVPETAAAGPITSEPVSPETSGDTSATVVSCTAQSWPGLGGRIVVLRVVGEIDLITYSTVQAALDAGLFGAVDRPTSRLVVDLAGVTFCGVRGFALLAQTAAVAAANGTGYALSGCSVHLERWWRILEAIHPWPGINAVARYVSTASAVIANLADQRTHSR